MASTAAPSTLTRLRVVVRDSGIGFDQNLAASLFDRFSQADNSVDNDIDGNMFFEAVVTATASGAPRRAGH